MSTRRNGKRLSRTDAGADLAWQAVCHIDDLSPDAGVAVRAHGVQVAVFLIRDEVYAIDNLDPFCGAAVLARGIVGDLCGELVVASPMYKQHFSLNTGLCLEDPDVRVRCWPVRRQADGALYIGLPPASTDMETRHEAAERP